MLPGTVPWSVYLRTDSQGILVASLTPFYRWAGWVSDRLSLALGHVTKTCWPIVGSRSREPSPQLFPPLPLVAPASSKDTCVSKERLWEMAIASFQSSKGHLPGRNEAKGKNKSPVNCVLVRAQVPLSNEVSISRECSASLGEREEWRYPLETLKVCTWLSYLGLKTSPTSSRSRNWGKNVVISLQGPFFLLHIYSASSLFLVYFYDVVIDT